MRPLKKSIVYRGYAIALGQTACWLLFGKIEFNVAVLTIDLIQTIGYYFFEKLTKGNEK